MFQRLLDILDLTGKRQLEKIFAGRARLTPEEFYFTYFRDLGFSQDVVVRIKRVFDARIGFDLARLSASDDFSKELKCLWHYDSLADVEVIIGLEEEFGIKIEDAEAAGMKTMADIVEIVQAKVEIKGRPNLPPPPPSATP